MYLNQIINLIYVFPIKLVKQAGTGKVMLVPDEMSESRIIEMLDNFTIGRRSDEGREKSTII